MNKLIIPLVLMLHINVWGQKNNEIHQSYMTEIEKITKNGKTQVALEHIVSLEPQTQKDLITLTEIPAPPFKEETRALKFKTMLQDAGADKVWIDEVGNVIALRKGTKANRTVVLDAHIDTVFPQETDVTVKFKGDTLYAPGIGDDTRGLVMILTVLRALEKANLETTSNIWFVGTVGEEGLGDLRGVKHLFRNEADKIDSWISIDGGTLGRVNIDALGSKRYRATFKGPGGHSWGAFGLVNPHHALGKAIDYFTQEASKLVSNGAKTSFNVGRIGGGTSVNSIPFESWMEVDMRSIDADRLNQIEQIFKTSMNKALTDYNKSGVQGKLELKLDMIGDRPSGEQSPNSPLIQRAMAATKHFGAQPRLTRGSTNSNIPISKGVPAVTIGRGGQGGKAHSLNEWWINDNGAQAIKLALVLTLAEAGLSD